MDNRCNKGDEKGVCNTPLRRSLVGAYCIRPLLLSLLLLPGLVFAVPSERPAEWAKPVANSKLDNFYQVSPLLYRSAQPLPEDFRELQQRGISEVLDLRLYHRDTPVPDSTLELQQAPLSPGNINPRYLAKALQVIANAKGPVLVHCLHGSDRTGLVVALYRVVCQGWSKQQAIEEMQDGGYGFHLFFSNIPAFIEEVDEEKLRRDVRGKACPAIQ